MEKVSSKLRTELRADIETAVSKVRDELVEVFRDSETRLLKAFYGFAETVNARFKDVDRSQIGLKERMDSMENRLLEVEKRLNLRPQP